MRERPLLFSGPMIRAALAGEKTVTRRVIGLPELHPSTTPGYDWTWRGQAPIRSVVQQRKHPKGCWQDVRHADLLALCPHGRAGDVLWCRETWRPEERASDMVDGIRYRADDAFVPIENTREAAERWCATLKGGTPETRKNPWRPSIFLPRWASRLTPRVTGVRVERLHAITDEEALREGVRPLWLQEGEPGCWYTGDPSKGAAMHARTPRGAFEKLWVAINGRASWDRNEWVWCVDFTREK